MLRNLPDIIYQNYNVYNENPIHLLKQNNAILVNNVQAIKV